MTTKIGFFFELDDSTFVATIVAMRRSGPHPDEERILGYLASGATCGVLPMLEEDLSENPPKPVGTPELVTDGRYVWPSTLSYYVKRYHVALPDEFVAHMRTNGWKVPPDVGGDDVRWEGETAIG